ncbi:MAG: iron-containing alcohol dehydrogenase [Deltaproteobacteria bacterium]|nr:iron-containing alcohol dehydrogenase [Deltaproteobacteria bacterium]
MNQYNYPTIILSGKGALEEFVTRLKSKSHKQALVVTDEILKSCGVLDQLTRLLKDRGISFSLFSETHPNPTEEDIEKCTAMFKENQCDSIIALGGGSPMDVAKTVRIMAVHSEPLEQYDDAKGGDQRITEPMPPLYAIPTTAGTGSEVGRSAVIIMRKTGKKAIYFHPDLIPDMAVLAPELTAGLPPDITAATGIDAFVHSLEAYFAPGLHPMADGIALMGMELALDWLPIAVKDGGNLDARERMLIAATMGAVAFQKGLGMIHSLAHPLSSRHAMHHGLANALLLSSGVSFLEKADLNQDQSARISRVRSMFGERHMKNQTLADACQHFIQTLGIQSGLLSRGIQKKDLEGLSMEAFEDPCHQTNMMPVDQDDLFSVYEAAF